jgi:hypothetical protein
MKLALVEAKRILEAEKQLFDRHAWKEADNRHGRSVTDTFRARVSLDGGAVRGLWFRVSTVRNNADNGMFQLDMERPDVRAHLPLYRLEWRPFRAHLNGPTGRRN